MATATVIFCSICLERTIENMHDQYLPDTYQEIIHVIL